MSVLPFIASILLILSAISGISKACSSRNSQKIRPPHIRRPSVTYRTYPCPKGPAERLCQNDGTCFTLFENSSDYYCKCREGFCGATCGDKYTRYGCYSSSLVMMASSGIARPADTFPCPPGPAEYFCLNGGTCFTVFENGTDYACHCTEGYCGLTCGEKYTRYGCFSTYLVISASFASVGTITVCVVVVVIVIIHLHKRMVTMKRTDNGKMNLNMTSCSHTLSMPCDKLDELENEDSENLKDLTKYLLRDDGNERDKVCEGYSNLIAMI